MQTASSAGPMVGTKEFARWVSMYAHLPHWKIQKSSLAESKGRFDHLNELLLRQTIWVIRKVVSLLMHNGICEGLSGRQDSMQFIHRDGVLYFD
jgi:hypothetical protein